MTLAAGRCALAFAVVACGAGTPPDPVRVTIPRGATLQSVAESLQAGGVVPSARSFRLYARLTGRERAIPAGTYDLHRGMGARRALAELLRARVAEVRLVVPEGLMLTEIAALVDSALDIRASTFLAAAGDPAMVAQLGATGTVEGYLYPSTYLVPVNSSAAAVVRQMTAEFQRQWRPVWNSRLATLGRTRHEIVVLASIIEGEVRHAVDAPYVASVYHNRLSRGMRLQADPTVIYALGRRRRLFERDYLIRSPFNTYQIDGLPPSPIGQPSAASLQAALYPARTDFLFLVARADGRHVFSRTLREHLQAVAAVRRTGARSDGRRSPASGQ
ncbi:MAG TPA: endolytic transglycosylase MltG [Gemmatimonadales bacterium]|nr:endolytic transglycosylase MltG [Gemmatimonadales bacterium]